MFHDGRIYDGLVPPSSDGSPGLNWVEKRVIDRDQLGLLSTNGLVNKTVGTVVVHSCYG